MTAKKIAFTGGGTAGHVMVNLALLPALKNLGYEPIYIGSYRGIEKQLAGPLMPYYEISSGKLRRYFDWQNFSDVFRVLKGILQSYHILKKTSPQIIFSKGGFVSVPVVIAGWFLKIPIIAHEADMSPGLANKIAQPFISHMCLAFAETKRYIKKKPATVTGIPIRSELVTGDKHKGLEISGFDTKKMVLLVMGGSSGSNNINLFIRKLLPQLLKEYQVIHLTGKGHIDGSEKAPGYFQCEFLGAELPHIYAATDIVISRAGANSIFEIFALNLPHILIPLPLSASRGDQIENAKALKTSGYSQVVFEEDLEPESFLDLLEKLKKSYSEIKQKMATSPFLTGTDKIVALIEKFSQ